MDYARAVRPRQLDDEPTELLLRRPAKRTRVALGDISNTPAKFAFTPGKAVSSTPAKALRPSARSYPPSLSKGAPSYGENAPSTTSKAAAATTTDPSQEAMDFMKRCLPSIEKRYRLIESSGEGAFSSVFKATRVPRPDEEEETVAIKHIYGQSSMSRIHTEVDILAKLAGKSNIVRLVDVIKEDIHAAVVLGHAEHDEFKYILSHARIVDIRLYMRSLCKALVHVHRLEIIHRDIKPANFLYSLRKGTGVLVDFGLAQKYEQVKARRCNPEAQSGYSHVHRPLHPPYPCAVFPNDIRPQIKAPRSGTRGFRAPEVLLKAPNQTTAIDMWSVGVILLCFITERFPFFNSLDDASAIAELAYIFGTKKLEDLALKLGVRLYLVGKDDDSFCSEVDLRSMCIALNPRAVDFPMQGYDFLRKCLEFNPNNRITAEQALQHPFCLSEEDDLE